MNKTKVAIFSAITITLGVSGSLFYYQHQKDQRENNGFL